MSPPIIGRFSLDNRILRPINRLRYTRQPPRIIRAKMNSTIGVQCGAMIEAHAEMHATYDRINSLWPGISRPITDDDVSNGWLFEVLRWCRDKLGGRDQDLVGPDRWEQASREGWSARATYSCLPSWGRGWTWGRYVHEVAHFACLMLPARFGSRNYDNHSLVHAQLELELTELVASWLADEAQGIKRTFPPLALSRPPYLRQSA